MKRHTEKQITKAVERMIDSWDLQTLVEYAVQERLDYFLGNNVDPEEVSDLIDTYGA